MSRALGRALGWGTPIQRLDSFCGESEIWIKRDDLLPFCFGGNKARIAACFMEDMRARGCSCMVGYGSPRSNLSRALACACAAEGVRCTIISPCEPDEGSQMAFNAEMVGLLGAQVVRCEKRDVRRTVSETLRSLAAEGERPYYIYGDETGAGNETVPTRAYKGFWGGLSSQCDVRFDELFLACGTGMTMGGILADAARAGAGCKVTGVSVARPATAAEEHVELYLEKAEIGREVRRRIPAWRVWDGGLRGGYGASDSEEREVARRLLSSEGLPVDLTYVGKAFAGMLDLLKAEEPRRRRVLFLHTGGTPIFFDNFMTGEVGM